MKIGELILHQILDENNGEMDAKKLNIEVEHRLKLIDNEINSKDQSEGNFDYCPLCGNKLKNKKGVTRRIHDIIFHYGYYAEQMGLT